VELLRVEKDLERGFDAPSVLEKLVKIDKEIAMIVAVGLDGETTMYPPAEMIFDPLLNLLDYQISPATLPEKIFWKAEAIAMAVVRNLNSPGLFAIELFVDKNGDVLVNETAPRVHNSGHHTIEGNYSSQFDMLWRIMLGYPLGCTDPILPSVILNIVGEEGYNGPAYYEGLDAVLKMEHAFVHIYGKALTKPGRKMGHVTVIGKDLAELTYKANRIKHTLKVITK
jgi:5-(carboxyamino)imidazole ribonucleotide synthase